MFQSKNMHDHFFFKFWMQVKVDLQIADATIAALNMLVSGNTTIIEEEKIINLRILEERQLVMQRLKHDIKLLWSQTACSDAAKPYRIEGKRCFERSRRSELCSASLCSFSRIAETWQNVVICSNCIYFNTFWLN